ncbi:basic leucine zipper 61-like isoform X2 [Humulus lupulus]|uniref:basic leucine zipper 61-like isoform X2 n=1 Tax=Humulus lupulus TaxID=3486 RepID=UPI002B40D1F2|nr:basic leucine zipper 61-like isoform X2 [Humulus lupulus]
MFLSFPLCLFVCSHFPTLSWFHYPLHSLVINIYNTLSHKFLIFVIASSSRNCTSIATIQYFWRTGSSCRYFYSFWVGSSLNFYHHHHLHLLLYFFFPVLSIIVVMAQLPPKIPNMTLPNWPDVVSHGKLPSLATNPSWVDEFLDFSTARRGSHRRSVSDSITFLETPMLDECRGGGGGGSGAAPPQGRATLPGSGGGGGSGGNNNDHGEFDRFDDEQFMSMFNDEMASMAVAGPNVSSSNPSTPSDHNSINDEKEMQLDRSSSKQQQVKNESEEVDSQCNSDSQPNPTGTTTTNAANDRVIDPKRVKRILANRQSAQRSRVRKLQYISELERSVTSLQAEVSVLSPRVAFLDHQRLLLNVDNSALKQRIAALAQDKIFKDG